MILLPRCLPVGSARKIYEEVESAGVICHGRGFVSGYLPDGTKPLETDQQVCDQAQHLMQHMVNDGGVVHFLGL